MRRIYTRHGSVATAQSSSESGLNVSPGYHREAGALVLNNHTRVFDIFGEEDSLVVSAQTDATSIDEFRTTGAATHVPNANVADLRARYWYSGKSCISWEVGRKRQIIYVDKVKYNLAGVIGADKTIRACCIPTTGRVRMVVKNEAGQLSGLDLSLDPTPAILFSYDVPLQFTANTGEESDIKQLYTAFMTPIRLVSVEITSTGSRVLSMDLLQIESKAPEWKDPVVRMTLSPLQVHATMSAHRGAPTTSSIGSGGAISGTTTTSVLSTAVDITDNVQITGKRIIACNSDSSRMCLLIEETTTSCNRVVDRPAYGYTEYFYVQPHALTFAGFVVGQATDYVVNLTEHDSGKLRETWTRSSSSTYTRVELTFNGAVTNRVDGTPFSGGTYNAVTEFYNRYAGTGFHNSTLNYPGVVPIVEIVTGIKAKEYTESNYLYQRTWSNSIRFLTADPLNDLYVFQRANGNADIDLLSYDEGYKFNPLSTAGINLTGTMELVSRSKGVESVLKSRAMNLETGTSYVNRRDINFEPTMPYYTQEQGQRLGMFTWTNEENKTINKSIDLCFTGRYSAQDPKKVGFAVNLSAGFDTPSFDYPTLSTDARYSYIIEGSVMASPLVTTIIPRPFLEAYRPQVKKTGGVWGTVTFDPDATLDIDYRLFEDRHRLIDNPSTTSGQVPLPSHYAPPEWPDIRGWIDFRNRGGFAVWDDAKVLKFASGSTILTNPPPISVVKK